MESLLTIHVLRWYKVGSASIQKIQNCFNTGEWAKHTVSQVSPSNEYMVRLTLVMDLVMAQEKWKLNGFICTWTYLKAAIRIYINFIAITVVCRVKVIVMQATDNLSWKWSRTCQLFNPRKIMQHKRIHIIGISLDSFSKDIFFFTEQNSCVLLFSQCRLVCEKWLAVEKSVKSKR